MTQRGRCCESRSLKLFTLVAPHRVAQGLDPQRGGAAGKGVESSHKGAVALSQTCLKETLGGWPRCGDERGFLLFIRSKSRPSDYIHRRPAFRSQLTYLYTKKARPSSDRHIATHPIQPFKSKFSEKINPPRSICFYPLTLLLGSLSALSLADIHPSQPPCLPLQQITPHFYHKISSPHHPPNKQPWQMTSMM